MIVAGAHGDRLERILRTREQPTVSLVISDKSTTKNVVVRWRQIYYEQYWHSGNTPSCGNTSSNRDGAYNVPGVKTI